MCPLVIRNFGEMDTKSESLTRERTILSKIRLIVSDLDGTLLSSDHRLTEQVKSAVKHYSRSGRMFTIATGRPNLTVRSIINEMSIQTPYILCNGSVIGHRDEIIEKNTLTSKDLLKVITDSDQNGLTPLLFAEKEIFVVRKTKDVESFEHKEEFQCTLLDNMETMSQVQELFKIILIGDMDVIQSVWKHNVPRMQHKYATFQSESNYLEIVPENHSKGTALIRLMEMLEMCPEEVLAIGNQLNDLDMLEKAGIGVAVANSHPLLKKSANYVCTKSYGDGVIEAIQKFC